MGRTNAQPGQNGTVVDVLVLTSEQAAHALQVNKNRFNSWWNPTRHGWDIPVGDTTVFVPSIGNTPGKRRVPRALLNEIASYGRTS